MQSGDSGAAADVDRVSALLTPEQRQEQDARVSGFSPAPSAAGETGATTADESPDRLTRRDEIKELQRLLIDRGYDPGVADGLPGSKTRDAIRAWQSDRGLPEVGQINRDVLTRLRADG
ncbi:MAG: peptidoglycan-binding domain-containing protein [Minwuia sp.]|uniref:peptidoglycan-binding domain-containing protein n=1 Tax=Minwuia sp. TaxID=2493630 RepID=UPI003A89198F